MVLHIVLVLTAMALISIATARYFSEMSVEPTWTITEDQYLESEEIK